MWCVHELVLQTSTWLCTICDKPLEFQDLVIDGWFAHILSETADLESHMSVVFSTCFPVHNDMALLTNQYQPYT